MTVENLELLELDRAAPGPIPTVLVSHRSNLGNLHASRVGLKRAAFLVVVSATMGTLAAGAVALAHLALDRQVLSGPYWPLTLISAVAVALMTFASRPDRRRSGDGYLEEWIEAGREMLCVGILLVVVAFFWRPSPIERFSFSRGTLLIAMPMGWVMLGFARCAVRVGLLSLRRRGHNLGAVIVIGDGPSAASFMRTMAAKSGTGYRVVAHVTEAEATHDLGSVLERLATTLPIEEVVVASIDISSEQIRQIVSHPSMRAARVHTVPELFGLPPSKVQLTQFADFPMLTLFENPVRGPRWLVKRAADVVVGGVVMLVLSPLLLAIAAAIKFTSDGRVLFRQERIGMDGKRFDVLKFRTMRTGAPDALHREFMTSVLSGGGPIQPVSAGIYKLEDDPRVTRVGKALRRLSLDELPQLVNVLRGEMSLVGPRPALSYEVELYEDWQRRRLDVLPGMTGLWQVSGRSRLSPEDMLRLDVHYAETWSLPKDFLIILRTIPALLRNEAR